MIIIIVFGMFWNLMTFWYNPFYAFSVYKSDPLTGALAQSVEWSYSREETQSLIKCPQQAGTGHSWGLNQAKSHPIGNQEASAFKDYKSGKQQR